MQESVEPLPHSPTKCRDTLLAIAKALYFAHLVAIGVFAGLLLITQPQLRAPFTFTLALVLFYGFILAWLLLFNLGSVVLVVGLSC